MRIKSNMNKYKLDLNLSNCCHFIVLATLTCSLIIENKQNKCVRSYITDTLGPNKILMY